MAYEKKINKVIAINGDVLIDLTNCSLDVENDCTLVGSEYLSKKLLSGVSAYSRNGYKVVGTGGGGEYQQKTVTPTTSIQLVLPDSGYNALSKVTVNAVTHNIDSNILAGYIKKGITILGVAGSYSGGGNYQQKTVTPTTSIQNINPDTGYDALSKITVNAVTSSIDVDIKPENIKAGVEILGVTGTYSSDLSLGVEPEYKKEQKTVSDIKFMFTKSGKIKDLSMKIGSADAQPITGLFKWEADDTAEYDWSGTISSDTDITFTASNDEKSVSTTVTINVHEYTVTNIISNGTYSNDATSVDKGASYTNKITAYDGYTTIGASAEVLMGGVDKTATAWNENKGEVTINKVTGDIKITINCKREGGAYTMRRGLATKPAEYSKKWIEELLEECTYNGGTEDYIIPEDSTKYYYFAYDKSSPKPESGASFIDKDTMMPAGYTLIGTIEDLYVLWRTGYKAYSICNCAVTTK